MSVEFFCRNCSHRYSLGKIIWLESNVPGAILMAASVTGGKIPSSSSLQPFFRATKAHLGQFCGLSEFGRLSDLPYAKHLSATDRTHALGGRTLVLHYYGLRILDLSLGSALHTVGFHFTLLDRLLPGFSRPQSSRRKAACQYLSLAAAAFRSAPGQWVDRPWL